MNFFVKFSVIALAILFLGCTLPQIPIGGNLTSGGAVCIQQNQSCGYGNVSPAALVPNQSTFYGRCCEGFACIDGNCKKIGEGCVANNNICGYGPVNLAHYDAPTYYGECCEGDCQNGYCKPLCKTSGSCNSTSECCTGLECMNGKCRTQCKTSGSCTENLDCCSGYYCNQGMQCAKVCTTSGACAVNSDCCGGYFCGPDSKCIPEPQPKIQCIEHRGTCNSTWECCAGLSCVGGTCTNTTCKWGIACNSTSECCTGLYCGQEGICNIQKCMEIGGVCNTTTDCCFGRKCENTTCVNRTCASMNESCTLLHCCSELSCLNYKCATPCKISGTCSKDSDCCSGYYCNPYGACAKLASCVYEYGNCTNSSQCCSGLSCYGGKCSKPCKYTGPCESNADCCAGYFCNVSLQCSLQPTQSTYDLCERQCANLGYNDWFCDPETSCGMFGAHLTAGDAGCPTAYHDWSEPNNEYCCCANHTQYDCNSACQRSGYNYGWGTVANGAACGEVDGTIPIDGGVCCCYHTPQVTNYYYCCTNPIGYNMCWDTACPSGYTQLNSYFTTREACSAYCITPQGQCSVSTPECGSQCTIYHQSNLSICGSGSCPTGYTQLTGNATCSGNPPCDRCCCQTSGDLYTQQSCQTLSQRGGFTHSQLASGGEYWHFQDCFSFAQTHCRDYHNGGAAPNGGLNRNCCYWYCSDEQQLPPPPPN